MPIPMAILNKPKIASVAKPFDVKPIIFDKTVKMIVTTDEIKPYFTITCCGETDVSSILDSGLSKIAITF